MSSGARTTLAVIDKTLCFTVPESFLACDHEGSVGNTDTLLRAIRISGVLDVVKTVARKEPGRLTAAAFVDEVSAPLGHEPVLKKHFAPVFFGPPFGAPATAAGVDTPVIVGASTSGCLRATAANAPHHGLYPIVPRQAVGDRNADAHEANFYDVNAEREDMVPAEEALEYLEEADATHAR